MGRRLSFEDWRHSKVNNSNIVRVVVATSRVFALVLAVGLFLALVNGRDALACSSFLVEKNGTVVAGRNLDSTKFTPGVVVINKRGVRKESRSWNELAYGQTVPNPSMTWVSKFGSITFNTF